MSSRMSHLESVLDTCVKCVHDTEHSDECIRCGEESNGSDFPRFEAISDYHL